MSLFVDLKGLKVFKITKGMKRFEFIAKWANEIG